MLVSKIVDGKYVRVAEETEAFASRLQEMLQTGQVPGVMTDSVFLEGSANGRQFQDCPHIGDFYREEATKAGVDVVGKVYKSGLAEFPGDPRAWISGRGDVQRLCEERGWNCRGAVNVKAPDEQPLSPLEVAPDLVTDAVAEFTSRDPGLAERDPGEVRAEVAERIKPHWAK